MTLRPSPPLRTVRASFPAYGSSLRNHSFKRAGRHNGVWSRSTTVSEVSRVGRVERVRLSADRTCRLIGIEEVWKIRTVRGVASACRRCR